MRPRFRGITALQQRRVSIEATRIGLAKYITFPLPELENQMIETLKTLHFVSLWAAGGIGAGGWIIQYVLAKNTDEHAGVDCEGFANRRPGHDGNLVFISRQGYDRQKWVNLTSHASWFAPQKKRSGADLQLRSQIPST